MKVAFVTDSACGVHPSELKKLGIYCIPLQIVFVDQNKAVLDFVDTTNEEIYGLIRQGQMMSTSVPPLGLIEETFAQIKNDGYDAVFCMTINPGLSSAYNAFRLGAENAGLTFVHVDIYTTSAMQKYSIIKAKEMYDAGASIEEIVNETQARGDGGMTFIIPNDLDHLKRGGRLTPLAATLAGLLKIKPILKLDKSSEGKIDVFEKIRTFNKAVDRVVNELVNRGVDDSYRIFIAHSDCMEMAQLVKEKIQEKFPNHEIEILDLVSVISVHTGCDCIGVQAFKK